MDKLLLFLGVIMVSMVWFTVWRLILSIAKSNQQFYEKEFLIDNRVLIQQYLANTLPFIPLRIEHRHPENLLSLCRQHPVMRFSLINDAYSLIAERFGESRIQVQLIDFRRVDYERLRPRRPLRIELIRCTEKFAIVTAGSGNYCYFLTKDRKNYGIPDVDAVFHISGKYAFREEIPEADSQPIVRPQVFTPNRYSDDLSRRRVTFNDGVEMHQNGR